MDLSLVAIRDPKAAPDQWMGIEAARAVQFVANRDPVGVTGGAIHIARDGVMPDGNLSTEKSNREQAHSHQTKCKLMD